MKTITKNVFLTVLSLVLFTGVLMADGEKPKKETGNIVSLSGQVVDQITGETLAGVKLQIEGTDEVIYTDFDGEFKIQCNLSKEPEISAFMISYEGQTIKVDGSTNLKISLKRQK